MTIYRFYSAAHGQAAIYRPTAVSFLRCGVLSAKADLLPISWLSYLFLNNFILHSYCSKSGLWGCEVVIILISEWSNRDWVISFLHLDFFGRQLHEIGNMFLHFLGLKVRSWNKVAIHFNFLRQYFFIFVEKWR